MSSPVFASIALATNRLVDQSAGLLTPEQQSAGLIAITADSAALLSPVQQSAGNTLGVWRPDDLGTDLLAWWDAEDLSAGAVASWVDRVESYDAVQATGANQPIKGARAVAFDGTDDFLSMESQPFPAAGNGSELWALVRQAALPADTGVRVIASYGGATNPTARRIERRVASGVNRATAVTGNGTTNAAAQILTVDFSGWHVIRGIITATGVSVSVNGGTVSSEVANATATGTTRFRIGSATPGTAVLFWQGDIEIVIVTNPLSALNAARMAAYMTARR